MAFTVNTNNEAMTALRLLNQTSRGLSTTQERINSGFKVNNAKDNASTFAIAQGMRGDVSAFKSISEAISLGQATVNVAMTAATSISDKLNEMKGKLTSAMGSNVDREALQRDIQALGDQITATAKAAQFNGVNLIDSSGAADPDLSVLSSLNRIDPTQAPTTDTITVAHESLDAQSLGVKGLSVTSKTTTLAFASDVEFTDGDTIKLSVGGTDYTFEFVDDMASDTTTAAENIAVAYDSSLSIGQNLSNFVTAIGDKGFTAKYNSSGNLTISSSAGDVDATATFATGTVTDTQSTGGDPATALAAVEDAILQANQSLSRLGTSANRLESQGDFIKSLTDTLTAGVGTLVDADLAEESAKLQALQTKQQLGMQALSIANQQPGSVLSLFR